MAPVIIKSGVTICENCADKLYHCPLTCDKINVKLFNKFAINPIISHFHDANYWHPTVMTLSALEGRGVPELWEKVSHFEKLQKSNGKFESRRKQQAGAWMWDRIDAGLKNAFRSNEAVQMLLPNLVAEVNQGTMAPSVAARRLLESMGHEFF